MPHIKITENGLYEIDNSGQTLRIDTIKGYFIPNLDGKYYGYIEMIPSHLQFAMENLYKQREFEPLLAKKTLLMLFYENWLNGNIDSKVYLSNLFNYLNLEQNPQIVPSILGYIGNICSKEDYFISDSSNNLRLQAEQNLIKYINNKKNSRYAAQAFRSLNSLASSNISLNYIYSIWDTQKTDINLNDRDYTAMAYQLGIKLPILMGDNAPMQSIDII